MKLQEIPHEGGMLDTGFARPDRGGRRIARCYGCGWEGIPTYVGGIASTHCPKCEGFPDDVIDMRTHRLAYDIHITRRGILTPGKPRPERAPKQGRNDPCACGGGKKYKKCHGA